MTTITEVNSKHTVDRTAVQSSKRFYLFTKHTGVLYTHIVTCLGRNILQFLSIQNRRYYTAFVSAPQHVLGACKLKSRRNTRRTPLMQLTHGVRVTVDDDNISTALYGTVYCRTLR